MNWDERQKNKYCDAMNAVHAPKNLVKRVQEMERKSNSKSQPYKFRRLSFVAAVVMIAFVIGNIAAVCAGSEESTWLDGLGRRTTFFVNDEEALLQAKKADRKGEELTFDEDTGIDWQNPEELKELQDFYDSVFFSVNEGDDVMIVSDETGGPSDVWTRRMVTAETYWRGWIQEKYAGDDIADLTSLQSYLAKWDISWLGENYTPITGLQVLLLWKRSENAAYHYSWLYGAYSNGDGGIVELVSAYDKGGDCKNYYINAQNLDFYEYYMTEDGAEFVIMGKGDKFTGELRMDKFGVYITTYNLSAEEVEEIAEHLDLATLVRAYSEN